MADAKKTELSLVIRTVDHATAKIKAINDRLDALTKPFRDFKGALSDLGEKSGLDSIAGGLKNIASGMVSILEKVALLGVGATAYVFHLVHEFDELGKKAKRLGVAVDFLAEMRYAAEQAGVPVEALDEGMQTFSKNLGLARANTGRMAKFLGIVSPALLTQLKAAKGNREAFLLLADAMAKLEDPAKRAALAEKTIGNADLAEMLAQGSKAIKAQADEYDGWAGSQQGAADASEQTEQAIHHLHAAVDGAKAGIVSGLAPALTEIVDKLAVWVRDHQGAIAEFAKDFGEKLPGYITQVVDGIEKVGAAIKEAFGWAKSLVDALGSAVSALDKVSGSKKFNDLVDQGLAEQEQDRQDQIDDIRRQGLPATPLDVAQRIQRVQTRLVNGPQNNMPARPAAALPAMFQRPDVAGAASAAAIGGAAARPQTEAKVNVVFENAPKGTRVTTDPRGTADVETNVGYQMIPGVP